MFLIDTFILIIYQPFFNILLFLYWFLGLFSQAAPDMGVAVILLAIFIRLLLLPFSLAGTRTEKERREIAQKVLELEEEYKDRPHEFKLARKKIFSRRGGVLAGEMFSLITQIVIALILWKIFDTGLKGADFHLIYPFMPEIDRPFNLLFLGTYDLTRPSLVLNLFLAFLLFIFETLAGLTSPYPTTRAEVVRLQLTLPLVSFLIFTRLPAGKLLFVIVTMIVSIILLIGQFIFYRFMAYKDKIAAKEAAQQAGTENPEDEKVVIQTIE